MKTCECKMDERESEEEGGEIPNRPSKYDTIEVMNIAIGLKKESPVENIKYTIRLLRHSRGSEGEFRRCRD